MINTVSHSSNGATFGNPVSTQYLYQGETQYQVRVLIMSVKRVKDWVTKCDESREVKRRKSERKEEKTCQGPCQGGHRERVKLTELVERLKRTRSRRKLNKLVKRWIWLPNRSQR